MFLWSRSGGKRVIRKHSVRSGVLLDAGTEIKERKRMESSRAKSPFPLQRQYLLEEQIIAVRRLSLVHLGGQCFFSALESGPPKGPLDHLVCTFASATAAESALRY